MKTHNHYFLSFAFALGLATFHLLTCDLYCQNVAINDDGSTPGAFLHVKYTTSAATQAEIMRIERKLDDITAAKEGVYMSMKLTDGDNGGVEMARIGFRSGGSGTVGNEDEGELSFSTSSNTGAIQERMTINSEGKVGIGVSDPSTTLDIAGDIRIRGLASSGLMVVDELGNLTQLPYGSTGQLLSSNGTWSTPAVQSAEISICEFLTSETVANRAAGLVVFVVPATMNGKSITKAIARANSGNGTTVVRVHKNATTAFTTISGVSSTAAVQSATLATPLATGDLITISTTSTSSSATLTGLTITLTVQ